VEFLIGFYIISAVTMFIYFIQEYDYLMGKFKFSKLKFTLIAVTSILTPMFNTLFAVLFIECVIEYVYNKSVKCLAKQLMEQLEKNSQ
jgi:hypothetical protein